MFEYREVLVRMRAGASNHDVERSELMGRKTAARVRRVFDGRGWLVAHSAMPGDVEIVAAFERPVVGGAVAGSMCEPYRAQITKFAEQGVDATTIWSMLCRQHAFEGSYSSAQRFVKSLALTQPKVTSPLSFAPGETAQVDFGRGPDLVDHFTGEVTKTWFFVMTLCWSRHMYVEFVLDQTARPLNRSLQHRPAA